MSRKRKRRKRRRERELLQWEWGGKKSLTEINFRVKLRLYWDSIVLCHFLIGIGMIYDAFAWLSIAYSSFLEINPLYALVHTHNHTCVVFFSRDFVLGCRDPKWNWFPSRNEMQTNKSTHRVFSLTV